MSEALTLDNTYLKETMTDALVNRSTTRDFNTALTPCHTTVSAEYWVNHPPGAYKYGTLLIFGSPASFVTQIYFPHNSNAFYWRMYFKPYNQSTYSWQKWVKVLGEFLE